MSKESRFFTDQANINFNCMYAPFVYVEEKLWNFVSIFPSLEKIVVSASAQLDCRLRAALILSKAYHVDFIDNYHSYKNYAEFKGDLIIVLEDKHNLMKQSDDNEEKLIFMTCKYFKVDLQQNLGESSRLFFSAKDVKHIDKIDEKLHQLTLNPDNLKVQVYKQASGFVNDDATSVKVNLCTRYENLEIGSEFKNVQDLHIILDQDSVCSQKNISLDLSINCRNLFLTLNLEKLSDRFISIFSSLMDNKVSKLISFIKYEGENNLESTYVQQYLDIISEKGKSLRTVGVYVNSSDPNMTMFSTIKHSVDDIIGYIRDKIEYEDLPLTLAERVLFNEEDPVSL